MVMNSFREGRKVRINIPGNAYHGKTFTLTGHGYNGVANSLITKELGTDCYFLESQVKFLALDRDSIKENINDIKAEQEKLNKELDHYRQQLAFLDETNQDTFDEVEFKTFYALKVLEQNNLTTAQRAKSIAGLVNLMK